ncbi:MAG: hypothetical protein HYU37_07750 [Acidobacteria bacterium]|nr:hypothetical protein [Acidobacteriota bacterium]
MLTLHTIGLGILVGANWVVALRVLGLAPRAPVKAVMDLMPVALAGFLLNLITGVIFVAGMPGRFAGNFAFHMKMLFIVAAGLNALYFQLFLWPRDREAGPGEDVSRAGSVVGGISLFCWLAVAYFGRMLPSFEQAF